MAVEYLVDDDAVIIRLNDPASRNGLDDASVFDLRDAIARASREDKARFLLLAGLKEWFCIGGSGPFMEQLLEYDVQRRAEASRSVQGIVEELIHCPLFTVVLLDGLAAGAGADMVLAADLALATDSARFALLYAKLGLIPDTGFVLLDWRLGHKALSVFAQSSVLGQAELVAAGLAEAAPGDNADDVLRHVRRRFRFVKQAFVAAKRQRNLLVFHDLAEKLDAVAQQQSLQFEEPETRSRLLYSATTQRRKP